MKSDSGENNDHHQPDQKINTEETRPARSYDCSFCKRGFTNAQALGGHMNIHRKDKAKAKESKPSPTKSYNHSPLFSIASSELPINNYLGLSQSSYQVYFPSYPGHQPQHHRPNFNASRVGQRDSGEDHGELDLSLNFGVNNDEYGGRRHENQDENEVDLELRLGNHPG